MNIGKRPVPQLLTIVLLSLVNGEVLAYPRLDWRSADFESRRVIAESAWQTEREAKKRGEELHFRYKYRNLGVLWIPYYRNLSGKRLYQTIIVPEGNCDHVVARCDRFLKQNRQRLNPDAYCFTPSNRGLDADRRGGRFF